MANSSPLVSIIMPAYNCENYIAEAIQSILNQSLTDWELIIVDDGSVDKTYAVAKSFADKDHRIRLFQQKNTGQALASNYAISLARGKYIAKMDADDISLPDRLQRQYDYMQHNPSCKIVSTYVRLVDPEGKPTEEIWRAERAAFSPAQIKTMLPLENCVANAPLFAQASLMKKYGYRDIFSAEDYDLWLRLAADNVAIHKIPQELYIYRRHNLSTISVARQTSLPARMARVKLIFLYYRLVNRHFAYFEWRVFVAATRDLIDDLLQKDILAIKIIARLIRGLRKFLKGVMMLPHYLSDSLAVRSLNSRSNSGKEKILVILPWMTVGGADKVLLDICHGLSREQEIHFITTETGQSNEWHEKFARISPHIHHIAAKLRIQRYKIKYIQRYCRLNNIQTVLISNCLTGYEALPSIREARPHVQVLDILHGQGGALEGGGYPKLMQPYEKLIDKHIVVTNYLKEYLKKEFGNTLQKIEVIHNGVDTQHFTAKKKTSGEAVSWVGRFSPEKHPEIFVELARAHPEKEFKMAGDGEMFGWLKEYAKSEKIQNLEFLGSVDDVRDVLNHSKVLVMTSEIEGLPIVLLEAGAMGIPAIAPSVGGIPEYVTSGKNGYLINDFRFIKDYSSTLSKVYDGKLRWSALQIRHEVERDFSLDKMVEAYEQAIG